MRLHFDDQIHQNDTQKYFHLQLLLAMYIPVNTKESLIKEVQNMNSLHEILPMVITLPLVNLASHIIPDTNIAINSNAIIKDNENTEQYTLNMSVSEAIY